jgi:hypothetical protein
MKSLLLTKEKAFKKLEDANAKLYIESMKFTGSAIKGKDNMSKLMGDVRTVTVYYDSIYLIFLKNYMAETVLLNAIDKKNVHDVERNKDTLSNYAQEGLDQLDSLKPYKKDPSLLKTCKEVLNVYIKETGKKIDNVTDYFSEADDFEKTRKEYEKKPSHPNDDVISYSKSVKQFNHALAKYNKTIHTIYKTRKHLLNKWDNAAENFFDTNLPAPGYAR